LIKYKKIKYYVYGTHPLHVPVILTEREGCLTGLITRTYLQIAASSYQGSSNISDSTRESESHHDGHHSRFRKWIERSLMPVIGFMSCFCYFYTNHIMSISNGNANMYSIFTDIANLENLEEQKKRGGSIEYRSY